MTGLALIALVTVADALSNDHQETLKETRFITYKSWKLHDIPGAICQGHRWREIENMWVWASAFIGVMDWWPRVGQTHYLLVNLKHKSRNLKYRRKGYKRAKWSVI